ALNGSASPGRQALTITAGHLQLTKAARVTGASVQASFDGGKTWHHASVTAIGGGGFRASFTAPARAYITLRTTAHDAAGGSITETITRGYATAPLAPVRRTGSMIMTPYHDFGLLRWAICPVCPTEIRDITSLCACGMGCDGGCGGGSARVRRRCGDAAAAAVPAAAPGAGLGGLRARRNGRLGPGAARRPGIGRPPADRRHPGGRDPPGRPR